MFKDIIKELRDKNIDEIYIDELMKNHTSFKIGGPVDLMVMPKTEEEVISSIGLARKYDLPFLILGNGSNMLVRDQGIRGMVIKLNEHFNQVELEGDRLVCQSGALLSVASKFALKNSLSGMEFASGIPGSLGGAITMNAGAYGGEMKDIVARVKVLDRDNKVYYLDKEELNLRYRGSRVKDESLIVLSVDLALEKANYDDIYELMEDLKDRRNSKQPLTWPSGGSTFKRPEGYYAGKLIDDSGLRGLRYKDAQVSEKHCGFIINRGEASCQDVLHLVATVQKVVKDNFGVDLEREIMLIGDE